MTRYSKTSRIFGGLLCSLLLFSKTFATETIVIGGETTGLSWEDAAESAPVIDFDSRPGWIQPNNVSEDVNIALRTLERGGQITSPNAQAVLRLSSDVLRQRLESVIDGNPSTAFEAKNVAATGILLVIDLGARFGVDLIRFFPRETYQTDFMKGYVLSTNDGVFGADIIESSADKLPDQTLLTVMAQDGSNNRDTIDVRFPLQYVRYIRLESTQRFNWEIDEIEIFGRGFVPESSYLSQVFDMGQESLWGQLTWDTEQIGANSNSRLTIRTRSGNSSSPNEDPSKWSDWSTPYESSGDPIMSPAPHRYFQFSISFESDGLEDAIAMDSLAFEFFRPALAKSIVGEIWPQEVAVGVDTSFEYTIRVSEAEGFNRIQIDTPAPVSTVREVRLNGEEISFTKEPGEKNVIVSFAHQTGSHDLQLIFDTAVLRYETVFTGRLFDTTRDGALSQAISGGDVTSSFAGNDLSVRVPIEGQSLVYSISVNPAVFTPNGDGVNDKTTISYDLLYLTGYTPLTLRVYNLAGNELAALKTKDIQSGRHSYNWDGRNAWGELLPPGIYILQVEVDTDSGTETRSATVAIAY